MVYTDISRPDRPDESLELQEQRRLNNLKLILQLLQKFCVGIRSPESGFRTPNLGVMTRQMSRSHAILGRQDMLEILQLAIV